MNSIGIREAKARLPAVARAAANGETTIITDYGKPIARIAPLETPQVAAPKLEPAPVATAETPGASDPAAFLNALLSAPFELDLDF